MMMADVHSDLYQQQPMSLPPVLNTTSQIDQEFSQINQQFQDLSLQYQNPSYEYGNLGVENSHNQPADINNYADSTNQYPQQNLYEPQPAQPDYYGHAQQNDAAGNNGGGFSEHQTSPMYQQQPSYNDQLAYGAPNYGNTEVNSM